jgi:hypothetical protein
MRPEANPFYVPAYHSSALLGPGVLRRTKARKLCGLRSTYTERAGRPRSQQSA